MTLDLDQLEALAKAALSRGEEDCESLDDWFSQEEFMSNMLLHPVDARFAEACAPRSILSLIAEVRALREDVQAAKLLAHANGEMFKAEKAENEALRRQSLELLGVVIDVEQGGGFDDACLATIKRVMNVLAGKEKA